MTTISDVGAPAPGPAPDAVPAGTRGDHRGSWIPTWGMVTTRFMELRKRRGLMIALIAVNIGIPVVFLGVRLVTHAVDPKSYGPAGGYDIFTTLVLGFMYIFGFIVAAVVGCTAGSVDLTEGMFRHLVITGRSRLALYLARIPAGLAIVIAMVAVGYTIVCAVCVFAAPTQLNYDGVNVPAGALAPGPGHLGGDHADQVICNFNFTGERAERPAAERPVRQRPDQRSAARNRHPDAEGHDHRPRPHHRRRRCGPSPSRWPTRTTRTTASTSWSPRPR